MLWLFVGPTGVYLLDFFCFSIQFYLLLSPYLCFISLLYLDLYESTVFVYEASNILVDDKNIPFVIMRFKG